MNSGKVTMVLALLLALKTTNEQPENCDCKSGSASVTYGHSTCTYSCSTRSLCGSIATCSFGGCSYCVTDCCDFCCNPHPSPTTPRVSTTSTIVFTTTVLPTTTSTTTSTIQSTSTTEITTVTTRTTTISITNTSTIPSTTTSDGSEIVILNRSLYCSVLIILVFILNNVLI